jgi:GNAT superfamily N-acetyltransferase
MKLRQEGVRAKGRKFTCRQGGRVVGRAFLYILRNELHDRPFGLLEDVFVEPEFRGRGIASTLVQSAVAEARKRGCYKLVATSRHERAKVHDLYFRLGFRSRGIEFRIDFEDRRQG